MMNKDKTKIWSVTRLQWEPVKAKRKAKAVKRPAIERDQLAPGNGGQD